MSHRDRGAHMEQLADLAGSGQGTRETKVRFRNFRCETLRKVSPQGPLHEIFRACGTLRKLRKPAKALECPRNSAPIATKGLDGLSKPYSNRGFAPQPTQLRGSDHVFQANTKQK